MGRQNDSRGYSYYFDRFGCKMYDFNDKELALRHYLVYMLNRTQKIFEYKNLPDTIPKRMLEFLLQVNGFACVTKVKGELYAFRGGLGGEPDPYYRPTLCVVANPALKFDETLKIDKDCVILRNDSFLYGLLPLFTRYASAMVENDISFRMASINTRIQAILSAPDDATKDAAEKYLKDVADGKLGAIQVNAFLDGITATPMTTSIRTFTDLIEYQQYLKASWYNEIGLNANYNMKREKLSTTESQMNNDALLPLVDDMLESRRVGLEKINAMFGTDISVEFASSWEKLIEEFQAEMVSERSESEVGTDENEASSGNSATDGSGEYRPDDGEREEVSRENDSETSGDYFADNRFEELRENSGEGTDDNGTSEGDSDSVNDAGDSGEVTENQSADDGNTNVTVEVTVNVGDSERSEKEGEDDAETGRPDESDDGVRKDTE